MVRIYSHNDELINLIEKTANLITENKLDICIYDSNYGDKTKIFMPCIFIVYSEEDIVCEKITYPLLYPFGTDTFLRTLNRIFEVNKLRNTYMKNNIEALFNELGLDFGRKGTQYLLYAVKLKINSKNSGISMNSIICRIAQKYMVSENSVERNMRTAIENVCEYGKLDKIYELFGGTINSEKGKPTNSQFISVVAEKCKYNDYTGKHKKEYIYDAV